jgi:formylglycine-generating enzyme required for sulfatase activity
VAWGFLKDAGNADLLRRFITEYPASLHRQAAEERLAVLMPAPPPGPPPAFLQSGATPLAAAQERMLRPKDSFRECADCPEMVVVPAGAFTMGSPKNEPARDSWEDPQHVVNISSFAVGKFHVTRDQFAVFANETGFVAHPGCDWQNPLFALESSHPAVCMSWNDAKAYADWLAKKTGKLYRLLSEAEWEYAARGQTTPGAYPRFWFGNDENVLCQYAIGSHCHIVGTIPAGKYKPNAFGLYDMAGNAWQWTEDCWHDNYSGAPTDGSAWTSQGCGDSRVVRGGSWSTDPWDLRAAHRYRYWYSDSFGDVGFRLARTLAP